MPWAVAYLKREYKIISTCLSRYPVFITCPLSSIADSDVSAFTLPRFFKLSDCEQTYAPHRITILPPPIDATKMDNQCIMSVDIRQATLRQGVSRPVLTKLYSAVESSMNCSLSPAVRRASMLLRPTVRRKPSSSRAEASVTASRRVRASCTDTSQSTTAEPAGTPRINTTSTGHAAVICTYMQQAWIQTCGMQITTDMCMERQPFCRRIYCCLHRLALIKTHSRHTVVCVIRNIGTCTCGFTVYILYINRQITFRYGHN